MQDYINCSCLGINDDSTTSREKSSAHGDMISGSCAKRCDWLYVFCVLFFGIMVCTFATMSPNVTAVIKLVSEIDITAVIKLLTYTCT